MLGEILIFALIGLAGSCAVWLIIFIIKKLFKVMSSVVIALLVFLALAFFYTGFSRKIKKIPEKQREEITYTDTSQYQKEEEESNEFEDNFSEDKDFIYNSIRWSDYYHKQFSIQYKIAQSDLENARINRSGYNGYTWADIYDNLYMNDNEMLTDICKKYDSLRADNNPLDFARLVVSSIQEIPYTYILSESCSEAPNREEINRSGYPCLGNIKNYAVQSPVEFLSNLKGDCDTKAMALYTILRQFNYDVCIMISEQYKHAVLGINLPAHGKYLEYLGKRYYMWETTVEGLDIGQMPPEYSNMAFWEIAL